MRKKLREKRKARGKRKLSGKRVQESLCMFSGHGAFGFIAGWFGSAPGGFARATGPEFLVYLKGFFMGGGSVYFPQS
jgi:hypothetical protein